MTERFEKENTLFKAKYPLVKVKWSCQNHGKIKLLLMFMRKRILSFITGDHNIQKELDKNNN